MAMDQMNWSMYVVFIIFPNFSVSGGWRVGGVIGGFRKLFSVSDGWGFRFEGVRLS